MKAIPLKMAFPKQYTINIDNIELFGTDIKSSMFAEISEDDKLVNYGYHIGTYFDENNQNVYPYTESELISEYDNIYNKLSEWYGDGEKYTADEYSNILKGYEWNTEYGDMVYCRYRFMGISGAE